MLLVSALNAGGAQRVAVTLANAWTERGDSVTLVPTFSGRGECFYSVSNRVQLIFLSDIVRKLGRSITVYFTRFLALRRLIRATQPDIVVSFLTNVNIAAILATRGLKSPVIVSERTNPQFAKISGRSLPLLRRLTYPLADLVTVLNQDMVIAFHAMVPGIKRLEVVANPIPSQLAIKPAITLKQENRHRLIAMGRLVESKQFSDLIASFSTLTTEFPEWDLWIWGEGPLRAQLEKQVQDFSLNNRVYLPGNTRNPWQELEKGSVFVLSSAYEGFPNVLLEAMALGLSCVAFDCPSGPREMTRNGQDGLLVPLGVWPELENALRRVMNDPMLRHNIGQRAAVSVRERYSLESILQRWDELFAIISPNVP
ncbi:MAG: glycosyltransferase family 4 protein [Candidatus Competibacter sp.]